MLHPITLRQLTYRSIAPAPMRGFVLSATPSDDSSGFSVNAYPIRAIALCEIVDWEGKPAAELRHGSIVELNSAWLERMGFKVSSGGMETRLVPVVHIGGDGRPWSDDEEADNFDLYPILSTVIEREEHSVIWCTWDESEDARRIAQASSRLLLRAKTSRHR